MGSVDLPNYKVKDKNSLLLQHLRVFFLFFCLGGRLRQEFDPPRVEASRLLVGLDYV